MAPPDSTCACHTNCAVAEAVSGPGYRSPLDASKGPKEKLLYVPAIVPDQSRPDYLITIDVDPDSPQYQQVIHRTPAPYIGDELHHSGWNACSSCVGDPTKTRNLLILPGFKSGRVYAFNVGKNPRAPTLEKVVEPEDIQAQTGGLSALHTTHCLGTGEIVISALGDKDGNARGGYVTLDQDLNVKGSWTNEETKYGYDYWYQPRHNVFVTSEFGAPSAFSKGFDPSLVPTHYGSSLHFWDWDTKKLKQSVDLGPDGLLPLETRFLHDPSAATGFTGAALSSNIIHFSLKNDGSGEWATKVAIRQPWTPVEGWALPELPPLITDILISLDDKYLYYSNWLRGDINQYDITDPENPVHVGRVWVGGSIRHGSGVKVTGGEFKDNQPVVPAIKGVVPEGGPQMLQLSLDGKRLYVTNSIYSSWDKQFYPDLVKKGSVLLRINVDNVNGGLTIDEGFLVDFGQEPDGPVLAHEVRYPGGDCSSDIWL